MSNAKSEADACIDRCGESIWKSKREEPRRKKKRVAEKELKHGERFVSSWRGLFGTGGGGANRRRAGEEGRRVPRQTLARVLNYACNMLNYFSPRVLSRLCQPVRTWERDYATLNS